MTMLHFQNKPKFQLKYSCMPLLHFYIYNYVINISKTYKYIYTKFSLNPTSHNLLLNFRIGMI